MVLINAYGDEKVITIKIIRDYVSYQLTCIENFV